MTLDDLYRLMRSGHVQAQGVVDTLADPLLVLDGSLGVRVANPAFLHAFGLGRDEVLGRNLFQLGQEGWNVPALRHLLEEVIPKAQAVIDYEVHVDLPPRGSRTLLLSARRLVHPDHNSPELLVVLRDVTDASRAAARRDILLAESQHRLKNFMAMVQALVSQTKATGQTGEAYRDVLLGRLAVLAQAQELELGEDGDGGSVGLQAIVARVLAPFLQQVRLAPGPDVLLAHAQVLPLSLILHELSTNAAKYGSLSAAEGMVEVRWEIVGQEEGQGGSQGQDASQGQGGSQSQDATRGQGGGAMLVLDWREVGGPPVTPPEHSGFGTRLIGLSTGNDLGGTVEQRFEPTGLVTRIEIPLV